MHLTEAFLAFCRLHGATPKACRPFRARTKGKVESGVKYVKRNALAGMSFTSFEALQAHLEKWMRDVADVRVHGTTHERPIDRFVVEAPALLPLKLVAPTILPGKRKVSADSPRLHADARSDSSLRNRRSGSSVYRDPRPSERTHSGPSSSLLDRNGSTPARWNGGQLRSWVTTTKGRAP